jgi:uncharacterized protein
VSLKEHIITEMKAAMKSGDKVRLSTIRLITAALKQKEVDERIELTDADVISILDKLAKQRRESIKQFQEANRVDLSDKEQVELGIVQSFLPKQLSESEINEIVIAAVASTGASEIKAMGQVMAVIKPQLVGKADMSLVSKLVKDKLSA